MNPSTIVKPCLEKTLQEQDIFCVFDENAIKEFSKEMLSADYWQKKNAISGTAQGRGTTYFIKHKSNDWVLRHYYRGGLIGKLIHDSYFFTCYEKTRAAQEFSLLKKLNELSLPAPKPIAYRVKRSGISYQADILTGRINNAHDLVALLSTQSLSEDIWSSIGACIRAFHQAGIYHHDLNAHNILIDNHNKIWLIDFDRGEQRKPNQVWQQGNLDRLLRSFNKEQKRLPTFHWQADNWQLLIEGYLKG